MAQFLRIWGFVAGQLGGVRIVFGDKPHERQLTLTFNFLSSLIALLVLLTAVWSAAAGILQTGRLAQQFTLLFSDGNSLWPLLRWLVLPLAALAYAAKAFGIGLLIFLASASFGAIVGFLFGVPRPISESAAPQGLQGLTPRATVTSVGATQPQNSSTRPEGSDVARPQDSPAVPVAPQTPAAPPGWQANTNLTQISDWLTKIIVGVGLVEAHKVAAVARELQAFISGQLFGGLLGTTLVLPALLVAGLTFGFMYCYLFTQLFLAALMARTADAVSKNIDLFEALPGDAAVLHSITPAAPVLAQGVRKPSELAPRPTAAQEAAARSLGAVPLDEVSDPDSLRVWARAQAVLDRWSPAIAAYNKLLRVRWDPNLLAEAARVFASAGDIRRARGLVQEALNSVREADPAARPRIVFDAAQLALYDPPPGGYQRALQLLEPYLAKDDGGGLHVLHACANGQKYTYEAKTLTDAEKLELRDRILADLNFAMRNRENLEWVRYLLGRDRTGQLRLISDGPDEDDDLLPFKDDRDFLDLIGLSSR